MHQFGNFYDAARVEILSIINFNHGVSSCTSSWTKKQTNSFINIGLKTFSPPGRNRTCYCRKGSRCPYVRGTWPGGTGVFADRRY